MTQQRKDDQRSRKTKIRQEYEDSDLEAGAEGLGTIPSESQSSRDVQISVSAEVSQGRDTDRFSDTLRGTTAGGIIRELLDENDELTAYHSSQIEFHNNRLKQLNTRRARLERLYVELQVKSDEEFDQEDEGDEVSDEEEE
ncbi:MAG TPA: hypothetical protein V6D26_15445 [Stenomitos sp.]